MAGRLIIQEPPQLIAPYILVGMNGWLNAGEISTGSIDYLRRELSARKFAYIETQGFLYLPDSQLVSGVVDAASHPN